MSFVAAMNDATDESEHLCDVVTVEADILSGSLGILPYPTLDIFWFVENVGGVPGLRHLDDESLLEIEDILIAEQVHGTRPLVELLVVKSIVIRAPGDLRDIEVAR